MFAPHRYIAAPMAPSIDAYDPFDPDVIANPYPWYDLLRTDSPCHYVAARDLYVLSCYEDVVLAARNAAVFDANEPPALDSARRRELQPRFITRALTSRRGEIDELVAGCLDAMVAKQTFDLVDVLARPLPRAILGALMPDLDPAIVEAGTTTMTNLIGNAALTLMSDPLQWRRLQQDRALVPSLIEETLRYEPPVQGAMRTTREPVEVRGTSIPAGATVVLLYGSANRDPAHYPEPDRFDVARNPIDHLGFGSGPHACLGAALARIEATAVAEAILARINAIRPAGEAVRTTDPFTRGVAHLPVTIELSV